MVLSFKAGIFNKSNSTTVPFDQAVTGVGFTPKALFLSHIGSNGTSDNMRVGWGFTDGVNERSIAWGCDDGTSAAGNASNTYRRQTINYTLTTTSSTAVSIRAHLKTFDADGFTLTFDDNTANTINVFYIALGGTDITNVKAGSFTQSTAAGNQAITGVGFQPDMLFFMGLNHSSNASIISDAVVHFGAASSPGAQWCTTFRSQDEATPNTFVESYQRTDRCIAFLNITTDTLDAEANLLSMDSDGFTLNWTDPASNSSNLIYYLAIKGGVWRAGNFLMPTATGNQAITGVGFTPRGLMMHTNNKTASTATRNDFRYTWGAADSPTSRWNHWGGDQDLVPSAVTARSQSNVHVIRAMTEAATGSASTTQAAADLLSLDADGFTLSWSSADATTQRQVVFVAAGNTVTGQQLVKVVNETVNRLENSVNVRGVGVLPPGETVRITETTARTGGFTRTVNETERYSETALPVKGRFKLQPDDLVWRLSGGAANTSPNLSLGGARSNTNVVDSAVDNIFDDVTGSESRAGDVEYRCLYLYNNSGATGTNLTAQSVKVWISANTPAPDFIQIGVGTSAVNGTEQTVANENTSPSGITFVDAPDLGSAITLGDIPGSQHKAIWIKRIVPVDPQATIYINNTFQLEAQFLTDHN